LQQCDIWLLYRQRRDFELFGKDQRHQLHADVYGRRFQEWAFVESRIVGNGNVTGASASTQQRSIKLADMHLTVERGGKFLLQIRTEAIDIDEQWNGDN